ncbi:hypothetical protein DFO73_1325 [Cytobacillus oceanisediminis]|jgi:hypothetical protein|uniref:Uncharacterized protein n=1 Tax=Cytobacillus oceanisediminis TaxID=665099 RepID=A0A2V2ZAZ7_9BACI|nr:hypothetical protein [Cytobacillus oceanisediminis]PWW17075.1 hypothetical protein DFO73_1325 [Cytobacillus oceanisediminis]
MKVIIETILNIVGSRGLRRGEFFVSDREFKDDANFAVAIVAYEWIQEQIKESSSRETIIEKVTWNEENDITEDVKQIQPVIKDDLPF